MPITALPTPPSRQDPANFAARGDALLSALPTFVTEANALQTAVNAKEASANTKAADASASAASALLSKNAASTSAASALVSQVAASDSAVAANASKNAADTSAGNAAGAAAAALNIYASAAAQQAAVVAATSQANLAAGYAASAASVAQQDLSGVTAAALHRSPNAVTAMCIYDTAKDSDGGAWVERMQDKSWMNEPLNGKWLGAQVTEAAARAVSGAVTGDYFQLTTDGKFYKLNATSGTTEVFRGNKVKFPRLAAIVAETANVTIYDLSEPGQPMWMRFTATVGDNGLFFLNHTGSPVTSVAALNGSLIVGKAGASAYYGHLRIANFGTDSMSMWLGFYNANGKSPVGIVCRNTSAAGFTPTSFKYPVTAPGIVDGRINAVAMTVLPDAPIDSVTGLQIPTIAVATAGGVSVIKHDGTVVNTAHTNDTKSLAIKGSTLYLGNRYGVTPSARFQELNGIASGWVPASLPTTLLSGGREDQDNVVFGGAGTLITRTGLTMQMTRLNNAAPGTASLQSRITGAYNTGYMVGDIRRCLLADSAVGSVTGAVPDRSCKAKPSTIYGTLTAAPVAPGAQLVAYSNWSPANYAQEPYSAELDFGTGAWSASAWINYSTAVASVITERSAATGPSLKLGTDATGKLVASAYDGTTTRTVTSPAAYNTGAWLKVRVEYTTDGTLALKVNGVQVASTTGAPLLTLSNAAAVLTTGNSRTLDAPFPGTLALVKLSATVPTPEQSAWMYAQEKQLFRDNAQCLLPDARAVVDLAYDDARDRWVVASAANESSWTGLVRTATAPVSAGSISKVAVQSGVKLLASTAPNPGVDITMPAQNLREELVRRAEAAAAQSKTLTVFDFDAIAAQVDFPLPVGLTATQVLSAGTSKREGATKDFTRLFDGFLETIRFAVAPGAAAWVQITARKA